MIKSLSGVYHMLPLGQRVEEKLQKLIDKHMSQIGEDHSIMLLSLVDYYILTYTKVHRRYPYHLFHLSHYGKKRVDLMPMDRR